jgi:hypothetical protein
MRVERAERAVGDLRQAAEQAVESGIAEQSVLRKERNHSERAAARRRAPIRSPEFVCHLDDLVSICQHRRGRLGRWYPPVP